MPDIRTGVVTSVGKMAKTITVTTRTMNPVPKLLVSVPHTNKYLVHDELDQAREGDKVTIIHSKPFSRRKHYQLHSIQRRIADADGKMTAMEHIEVEPIRKGVLGELDDLKREGVAA